MYCVTITVDFYIKIPMDWRFLVPNNIPLGRNHIPSSKIKKRSKLSDDAVTYKYFFATSFPIGNAVIKYHKNILLYIAIFIWQQYNNIDFKQILLYILLNTNNYFLLHKY